MSAGLAIEAATDRAEVLVRDGRGATLALETETIGNGHTRRLAPLVARALDRAGVAAGDLAWIAADLGPGSFTGVRVGIATARALGLASGARVLGASSLAALALASGARRALVVPLVPAGRRDVYAGFFRADVRGTVSLLAAPHVAPVGDVLHATAEARTIVGRPPVRFVGPGAARERAALERAWPGSTADERRFGGLSAEDLAEAVLSDRGPAAGLPGPGEETTPAYVRAAQAEERARHRALGTDRIRLRAMRVTDIPRIAEVEKQVFGDPWPASFFTSELAQPMAVARVAEHDGVLAGYSVAWIGRDTGHLGNLAVVPGFRRRGIARRLVLDLLDRARAARTENLTLEVRVSNFPAQALYRAHGFRLAGLRRGYYRDTGEDALVMEWLAQAVPADALSHGEGDPVHRS